MSKLPRSDKPWAIRIPPKLSEEIAETANIMGLPKQDVLRMATSIGIEHLKRVNYDVAPAILDANKIKIQIK